MPAQSYRPAPTASAVPDRRPQVSARNFDLPPGAGERAVRALGLAAAQFEKLEGGLRSPSLREIGALSGRSGSRERIVAAEARVAAAFARVLPALQDVVLSTSRVSPV